MKATQSRRPVAATPYDHNATQMGTSFYLSWLCDIPPSSYDARLFDAVSGLVESKPAGSLATDLTFDAVLTPGRSYYAHLRGIRSGEPGPFVTSNTILAV